MSHGVVEEAEIVRQLIRAAQREYKEQTGYWPKVVWLCTRDASDLIKGMYAHNGNDMFPEGPYALKVRVERRLPQGKIVVDG